MKDVRILEKLINSFILLIQPIILIALTQIINNTSPLPVGDYLSLNGKSNTKNYEKKCFTLYEFS